MKETSLPFDHRPDPVLGAALREALGAADHEAFVARVTAALAVPHPVHWDVLAAWARHGIAVACLGALGAGLLVGAVQPPMDLIESIAGPSAQELMATVAAPHPSVVLASPEVW